MNKTLYEDFANFFEQPTRDGLRNLLKNNFGEFDYLDFKKEWPTFSKVAKHVLAFSNSGGGCIVFGVSQEDDGSLDSKGIDLIVDKSDVDNGISPFIPSEIEYDILDYKFDTSEYKEIIGKKFQVLFIEDKVKSIPFISQGDSEGIRKNAVYVRRGSKSEEVCYEELQKIINRRVETGYSSTNILKLDEHIEQLKHLYSEIDRFHYRNAPAANFLRNITNMTRGLYGEPVKNPAYPDEDLESFIARMISVKKKKIERILEVLE